MLYAYAYDMDIWMTIQVQMYITAVPIFRTVGFELFRDQES